MTPMTMVIAHRGSSEHHADNTWPAFEAALAEGADCIECDVQMSRDGELVVRHDLMIGARAVRDCTFDDLSALTPDVVRLRDLIGWAERNGIRLLIEIKDPDAAEAAAETVAASRARDLLVLAGFHAPCLRRIKQLRPQLRTSLMMGSVLGIDSLIALAREYRADGIHPCWEARASEPHRLLDRAAVARLREAGIAVTLWHEERESELAALVALQPDGICTNAPARLRRIIDRLGNACEVPAAL